MRAFVPMLVVLALAAPAVGADHCESWTTSEDLALQADAETAFYVAVDCWSPGWPLLRCAEGYLVPAWVYEESNGIPGLQRGDEFHNDTCHGMVEPDRLVL